MTTRPFFRRLLFTAHIGVCAGASAAPATLVAFGDSTTAPRGSVEVYATLLGKELTCAGEPVRVLNAGVPSNTTKLAHARFEQDVLAHHPEVVIVQFGINDSAVDVWKQPPATEPRVALADYVKNLRAMVTALKARGTRTILMTPNPLRWTDALKKLYARAPYLPDEADGFNVLLRDYAETVRRIAREERADLVDVAAAFVEFGQQAGHSMDELLPDGMHPNARGHRLIADLLLAHLPKVDARFARKPVTPSIRSGELSATVRPLTHGPRHHFFGYIGHVRTIPWNASGRYILALQTRAQDRMPEPGEAAEIVLIDTQAGDAVSVVEQTRAWNPQQGTMLYWNPQAAETQFFFNDRDPATHEIFCVLYDVAERRRGAEFRYKDTPFGNSGVAQKGGWFLGINYARLARLRPVTGYPGARDWTVGVRQPEDDGIFKVHVATREKRLLVSFKQLADALRATHPEVEGKELFINHTLWNRDDDHIYFFVRGDFDKREGRCNVPCVMKADGTGLRALAEFIGGHPDWETGPRMIGARGDDQILFDTDTQRVVGTLGDRTIFPKPGGDVALSPDGAWFVNGHGEKGRNYYTILRRADGAWVRSPGLDQSGYTSGDLRLDPGPLWNRDSTQLLVPGLADDAEKTRQLFIITIQRNADGRR